MSIFSDERIQEMGEQFQQLQSKHDEMLRNYTDHKFENERAKEFALHGFMRRLGILKLCIQIVFDKLPPELTQKPSGDEVNYAMMALHAFVINVSGCIDNLAAMLVFELPIKKEDGNEIPRRDIGLQSANKANKDVLKGLSKDFQDSLLRRDEWFSHLKGLRDSLAHRIPSYIPPFNITNEDAAKYKQFEDEKYNAIRLYDFDKLKELEAAQEKLTSFHPVIGHSFNEKSHPMYFHPLIISYYTTVEEIATNALAELQRN